LFANQKFSPSFLEFFKHYGFWTALLEFGLALAGGAVVAWGLRKKVQQGWLLKRHMAERMRMSKYRSLLKLAAQGLQQEAFAEWKEDTEEELKRLRDIDDEDLEEWISENLSATEEPTLKLEGLDRKEFHRFLEYYNWKRLEAQIKYFNAKADQALRRDWTTRTLPPVLFLLSIVCVAIHFGIDTVLKLLAIEEASGAEVLATTLVALAACLPLIGAAIRTHRSAYEFSRNSMRFRAMHTDLFGTHRAVTTPDAQPATILKELWKAENGLE